MVRPCLPYISDQTDGATAPEYAVLAAVLGLAILGALNQLGSNTEARFDETAVTLAASAAAVRANGSIVDGLVKTASFEGYTERNMRRVFKRMRAWSSSRGFEAWGTGYLGVSASDGNNFLELDVEKGGEIDRIWQTIKTDAAQDYIIHFDMHQRGETVESVEFYWNDLLMGSFTATVGQWDTFDVAVTGTGDDTIEFRELENQNNGMGVLIDNIVVTAIPS